jgi:4-hydroxy-2-oxoheptanedioate aldolase
MESTSDVPKPVKPRLRIGTIVGIPSPAVVEIAGRAGCDFVILDMEHSPASVRDIEELVRAADAVGITSLVRVPIPTPSLLLRLIDTGVGGVCIPHLTDVATIDLVADAISYPPNGHRGICRGSRSAGYGLRGIEELLAGADALTVMGLIEDLEAVEAIEDILSARRLDAILPGPADLQASLAAAGRSADDVPVVTRQVVAAAKTAGKAAGTYVSEAKEVARAIQGGASFVVFNMDSRVLFAAYRDAIATIDEQFVEEMPQAGDHE